MLKWLLILSLTLVSTTVLMTLSTYFAILEEGMKYFSATRTQLLLFSNSFNVLYLVCSPLIAALPKIPMIQLSCLLILAGSLGRWLAGASYALTLMMTLLSALSHISIINAPYYLLRLFSDKHQGYASNTAMALPVFGTSFCIFYGRSYIISNPSPEANISTLNGIIAIFGMFSSVATLILLKLLRRQINLSHKEIPETEIEATGDSLGHREFNVVSGKIYLLKEFLSQSDKIRMICWGSMIGVSWCYGSLFSILFSNHGVEESHIATLTLIANLSNLFFSNLNQFIRNCTSLSNSTLIQCITFPSILSTIFITALQFVTLTPFVMSGLLCICMIVLRGGLSSFIPMVLIQMKRTSTAQSSSTFFWIANAVNLLLMEIVDYVSVGVSLALLSGVATGGYLCVRYTYKQETRRLFELN